MIGEGEDKGGEDFDEVMAEEVGEEREPVEEDEEDDEEAEYSRREAVSSRVVRHSVQKVPRNLKDDGDRFKVIPCQSKNQNKDKLD